MSNPNPERDGRVAKIRERWSVKVSNTKSWGERPTLQSVGGMEGAMADIDYLLSLLDNQAAETFAGPCVGCGHNNYDTDQKECKQRWMEGNYSVVCGCPCAKHNSLANAATRMRDRCVVHLQTTADALDVRQETECPRGTAFNDEASLRRRIAGELESLTPEQEKQP